MPESAPLDQAFAIALQHHRAGRLAEAEQCYRQILRRQPAHADSLHLLGIIALQTGHLEPALELIQGAVALRPDGAIYRNNLGQVLERMGRVDDAGQCYEAAIALDSNYAEAFNNLGRVLERRDRPTEAEAHYREAIRLDPAYAEPQTNLGNVLKDGGELDEAIAAYRRAIELRPDLSLLHSNLLLTLHYHPDYSPADLAREHQLWATRHVAPLAPYRRSHDNDPNPERRLRIGYVSPDFREHPIARCLLPLLDHRDRPQFEVIAYSDVSRPDRMTELVRAGVDQWRDIGLSSDEQVAEAVRADRVDILVDLAAHSGRNRLLVFARKPAPVQVTYLGYCSTTGVDAIDYRLTDRFIDASDEDFVHYSERSVRLPGCYWCYSAPALVGESPATDRVAGPPTFGCLNRLAKASRFALALWIRLLQRVEGSRLLLQAPAGSHRERIRDAFRRAGLDETRVDFVERQPFAEYLQTYRQIDVALDPWPFSGATTTCDALWMGVPVVSLAGRTAVSRAGSSLLSHVGLGHLVARSEQQYIDLAAGLMRDAEERAALRRDLRHRLESSPVMNAEQSARGLEAVFRDLWRTWCNGRR
jgi:protein O-GlcNAc transferase